MARGVRANCVFRTKLGSKIEIKGDDVADALFYGFFALDNKEQRDALIVKLQDAAAKIDAKEAEGEPVI